MKELAIPGLTDRQLECIVKKLGGKENALKFLRGQFVMAPPIGKYEEAIGILGGDIITPEEISAVRRISYSNEQIKKFISTMPSKEVLYWCKKNNYALVAGPSFPMPLLDIRLLNPSFFCPRRAGWFESQPFASNDKAFCRWLAIRKSEVPNSVGQDWEPQKLLLLEGERAPNIAEMSWFITSYCAVRGVRLFSDVIVRTCSVDIAGECVSIGGFNEGGLYICPHSSAHWNSCLGVSSSLKSLSRLPGVKLLF